MAMKTARGVALGGALSLALLSGCGSGPAENTRPGELNGVLEIQTGMSPDSGLFAALNQVVGDFTRENPDVELTLVPGSPSYEQDMKVRMGSQDLPDIWMTHGWSLLRYSQFLMPLQDEPWAVHLNPALEPAMVGDDGGLYALPLDLGFAGLLYNGDVLEQAGFTPEQIRTWADFAQACEAIKRLEGVSPIYVSGKGKGPAGGVVTWPAAGGFFTDADNQAMRDGTFVADKFEQILTMVTRWRDAGYFNPDYVSATVDDQARALAAGRAGFEFRPNTVGSEAVRYNPAADIGFMPIPSDAGTPYLIGGELDAFGIWKDTEYPATARAFLAFMARPENASRLAQASGSAPGLVSAQAELAGGLQASYDRWVTSDQTPLKPYWDRVNTPNGFWNTIVTTSDSVITKQASVDAALEKLRSDFVRLSTQGPAGG